MKYFSKFTVNDCNQQTKFFYKDILHITRSTSHYDSERVTLMITFRDGSNINITGIFNPQSNSIEDFEKGFEEWCEYASTLVEKGLLKDDILIGLEQKVSDKLEAKVEGILESMQDFSKQLMSHSSHTINQLNNHHFEAVKELEKSMVENVIPALDNLSKVSDSIIEASSEVTKFLGK